MVLKELPSKASSEANALLTVTTKVGITQAPTDRMYLAFPGMVTVPLGTGKGLVQPAFF